jgi:FkbH-like protein
MWQTDWAETPPEGADSGPPHLSTIGSSSIASTYLLSWNEHCVECAVPECFALCPLYVRRLDHKCARFKNGIFPNLKYPGLFQFGADIQFRRWGKLESTFGYGSVAVSQARLLDRIDRNMLRGIRPVSWFFRGVSPALRLNGAYAVFRERLLQRMTRNRRDDFDEFLIEVWNLEPGPVRLVLECWQEGLKLRTSILLEPGRTVQRIPADSMNVDLYGKFGMIRVYPENSIEAHLIFSWLDFVRYRVPEQQTASEQAKDAVRRNSKVSSKVKCVIWDLDQTVWDGILGEQDAENVRLRPAVRSAMLALDERGILQSIASKNDHSDAWRVLERLEVAHLFLYPQINWEPKSTSVQKIVTALNIGMDSCAFIDDSKFELAEVAQACPEIRTYADSDVPTLLNRLEFDNPVTEESKQRRLFYQVELQRSKKAFEYDNQYEAFLKSCEMAATLFRPKEPEHIERCLELLNRSNQLNLTTYRYTREEFSRLLQREDVICICTSCRDRFGDYGIVGFASLETSARGAVLKDFVLSCRVAQKKLENAWFKWLNCFVGAAGHNKIQAAYGKTPRNGVLLRVLLEVGFVEQIKSESGSLLELDSRVSPPSSDIVSVVAHGLESPGISASLRATG